MEGVSGEASSVAGHLGLGNLIAIYDDNEISIAGHTDLSFTENVGKRYEGYGWFVQEVDGHNFEEIEESLLRKNSKPKVIIAHTIKGKGISFMENEFVWHYKSPNKEELIQALKELK